MPPLTASEDKAPPTPPQTDATAHANAAAHGRTQTPPHAAASEHAPKEPAAARHGGEKHTNAMGIMCQNGSFGLSRDALSDRTILV